MDKPDVGWKRGLPTGNEEVDIDDRVLLRHELAALTHAYQDLLRRNPGSECVRLVGGDIGRIQRAVETVLGPKC